MFVPELYINGIISSLFCCFFNIVRFLMLCVSVLSYCVVFCPYEYTINCFSFLLMGIYELFPVSYAVNKAPKYILSHR